MLKKLEFGVKEHCTALLEKGIFVWMQKIGIR